MSRLPQLELLAEQNLLSALDLHFAELMCRLSADSSPELSLAAALASNAIAQGHVCLQLPSWAGSRLGNPPIYSLPSLTAWHNHLRGCAVVGEPGDFRPLILDGQGRLYLQRYWQYEQSIAQQLLRRAATPVTVDENSLRLGLRQLFPQAAPERPDWQKLAAAGAVLKFFSLISGGPGTGKTSIVVRILVLLQQQAGGNLTIALAAPTGKAAARVQAAIQSAKMSLPLDPELLAGIPDHAATIHRLLGGRPDSSQFRHHQGNPLAVDVLVIDEASMVDVALMAKLLQALPETCRLILLGDRFQLASVEAGSVLSDIYGRAAGFTRAFCRQLEQVTGEPVESEAETAAALSDCVVTLRHSYRFGAQSGIGQLAGAVNRGAADEALCLLSDERAADIGLFDRHQDPVSLAVAGFANYFELVRRGAPVTVLFTAFERFRLLTALTGSARGSLLLNQAIERELIASGAAEPGSTWYPGRPLIIRRNDYNLRLYNGDIGIVLDDGSGESRVCFTSADGQLRWIAPTRLPQWELAYALTVHKSQGSEFDTVVMVLPERDAPLLTRELLYTAITRARNRFQISGSEALIRLAVERRLQRPSGLMDALWGVA